MGPHVRVQGKHKAFSPRVGFYSIPDAHLERMDPEEREAYWEKTREINRTIESFEGIPTPQDLKQLYASEVDRLRHGINIASSMGALDLVNELTEKQEALQREIKGFDTFSVLENDSITSSNLGEGPVGLNERDALLHPEPPRPELRTPSDLLEAARDAEAAGDHKRAEALLGRARMDAPPRTRELYSRHRDLNPVATDEEINAERAARGAPPLNESELDRRIRLTQAVSFTNRGRIKESHAAGLAIKDIRERVAAGEITKEEGERLIAQNLHDREERLRIAREKGVARYAENAQALARSGRALGFGITAIAAQLVMIIAIVLVGFVLLQLFGAFSF